MELRRFKPAIIFLSFVVTLCVFTTLFPKLMDMASRAYLDAHGVTVTAEGTVSNKQYIAAHTDSHVFLFYSSSTFCPDEYKIEIRRYDAAKSKWETAAYDIDKATFNKLNVGDHYKDALSRTAYFQFESA